MSKNLILRTAAVLLIGTGAAFAQATAPTPAPTAPKAGTPATAPAQTAPKAATPAAPAAPAATAPKAAAPVAAPAATAPKAATPAPVATTAMVNLNTANEAELDKLDQIGPARAKAIIEARTKAKFKNWDDFVARNVVPKNAEDAIKGKVRF
jgi:competence protein ComEA